MFSSSYHKTLLHLLTSDMPLKQSLHELISIIENKTEGMYGSVLLMSPDKLHLIEGAAPSLPKFYREAIDGVAIGNNMGSCGTAAFTGNRVVVENISTHPFWVDFKHLALKANLQACWSQPIKQNDTILGTFALYYNKPQSPDEQHIYLIEEAAGLAKVLIEKELSKELVNEKERALKQAEKTVQWKSRFFANMSHELRTPLNGIVGIVDLLATTELNPQQTQYLKTLNLSTSTLLTVINDILEVSKISEGKISLEKITFNLKELIASLAMTYHLQGGDKVEMITSIDKNIPTWVKGDPTRLQQILNNILHNAFKFTAQGQIRLSVKAASQQNNRVSLLFKVADTGVGIKKEQLTRIFNQYEQGDYSTTRQFGGSGLGLYICKQLTTQFNGDIWADSEPGVGSTFYLTIELTKAEPLTQTTDLVATKTDYSGINVLLIEDNAINVLVVLGLLKSMNINVTTASNGHLGTEIFCDGENNFDLILMDCEMPIMDGYQATEIIREWETNNNRKKVPICALTAHAMAEHVERCLSSGMDYHLSKPIRKSSLESILAKIIP